MRVTPAVATAGRSPFPFLGGSLALDFVNTVGNSLDPAARRDYFQSKADVLEWMTLAGLSHPGAPLRASATMLEKVRSTRDSLYWMLHRLVECGAVPPGDLVSLNRLAARVRAHQRLEARDGRLTWTWAPSTTPLDRALGAIVLDAVDLLASTGRAHIRRCGDEHCGWLFVDRSQRGRRRWCSMADCGNRAKARRHYARVRRRRASSGRGRSNG